MISLINSFIVVSASKGSRRLPLLLAAVGKKQ
jgi:hypothetical protein